MQAGTLPRPPPPALSPEWALFLDVDGTLLDFAEEPSEVVVEPALTETLSVLHRRLGGALALVSGRPLNQLDELFAPLHLPAAGLHGLEVRGDVILSSYARPAALDSTLAAAQALGAKFPGAIVEDKGTTLALHWRGEPAAEEPLHEFASSALIDLPGYHLQAGDCVIELRPNGANKGDAVQALLAQTPFHARRPVFVGDDLTDEHAFAMVEALGGFGVLVGSRTTSAARYSLPHPGAVRAWLDAA